MKRLLRSDSCENGFELRLDLASDLGFDSLGCFFQSSPVPGQLMLGVGISITTHFKTVACLVNRLCQ